MRLIQEDLSDPWQHMVAVICLNLCTGKVVEPVLEKFFDRYPTFESVLRSTPPALELILRPIGLSRVRAKRIYNMSIQYQTWDGEDATQLCGIGKYGSDSYKIFFKNEIPSDVKDGKLQEYVRRLANG